MSQPEFLSRLCEATNAHDVDRIGACFTDDYVNVVPCHPARGFTGREQVRRNWTAILQAVPDLVAEVRGWVADDALIWSEWDMRGTRRDGVPHLMRGVLVFTVRDGLATHLRFFLEPVDASDTTMDQAVATLTSGAP